MTVLLSPKEQFQAQEDTAKQWREMVTGKTMGAALTHAIAQYSHECHPTTEQLEGVRRFIYELLNLAEKPEAPPTFPQKVLKRITPQQHA